MNQLLIALIAAAVIAAGAGYKGYEAGKDHVQAKFDKYKSDQTAENQKQLAKRDAENIADRAKFAAETTKRSIDHEKELATVRATARLNAGKRVPIDAARICQAAGPSKAADAGSGEQSPAPSAFLPEAFTDSLRQLAADADEITADARTMQDAIKSSGCWQ